MFGTGNKEQINLNFDEFKKITLMPINRSSIAFHIKRAKEIVFAEEDFSYAKMNEVDQLTNYINGLYVAFLSRASSQRWATHFRMETPEFSVHKRGWKIHIHIFWPDMSKAFPIVFKNVEKHLLFGGKVMRQDYINKLQNILNCSAKPDKNTELVKRIGTEFTLYFDYEQLPSEKLQAFLQDLSNDLIANNITPNPKPCFPISAIKGFESYIQKNFDDLHQYYKLHGEIYVENYYLTPHISYCDDTREVNKNGGKDPFKDIRIQLDSDQFEKIKTLIIKREQIELEQKLINVRRNLPIIKLDREFKCLDGKIIVGTSTTKNNYLSFVAQQHESSLFVETNKLSYDLKTLDLNLLKTDIRYRVHVSQMIVQQIYTDKHLLKKLKKCFKREVEINEKIKLLERAFKQKYKSAKDGKAIKACWKLLWTYFCMNPKVIKAYYTLLKFEHKPKGFFGKTSKNIAKNKKGGYYNSGKKSEKIEIESDEDLELLEKNTNKNNTLEEKIPENKGDKETEKSPKRRNCCCCFY